jgi:hypothetical protein
MTIEHPDGLIVLPTSHDGHMRVRRSGPHDVRAGRLVCGRRSGGLRIERPHSNPVRTYRYRRIRGVIRIGIASLRGTGKHVGNSRNAVRWLWFVSAKVRRPLHRRGIHAHRRLTDDVWIPRHAREAVATFAQNYSIALRSCIDDFSGLRNVIWSCGHCPSDFSCAVSPVFVGIPLCKAFDSARPINLIPIIRNRAIAVMALAKNLRLELWDLISELLSLPPLRSPFSPSCGGIRFLARLRKRQTFQFACGSEPIVQVTARLFVAFEADFTCATSDLFLARAVYLLSSLSRGWGRLRP